jgi:tetratricopeptide (TPR) repeat protein
VQLSRGIAAESAFGPDHPSVAVSLNNLALLYQDRGDYADAEQLYRRSLAILEKALGPDYQGALNWLNDLADPRRVRSVMSDQDKSATADTSMLTDADWIEIDMLRCAWESGGRKGLWKALDKLRNDDPIRYVTAAAAIIPDMVRNTLKDHMAENGITEEDLEETARKHH